MRDQFSSQALIGTAEVIAPVKRHSATIGKVIERFTEEKSKTVGSSRFSQYNVPIRALKEELGADILLEDVTRERCQSLANLFVTVPIHRGLAHSFQTPSDAAEIYADGQFARESGMEHDDVAGRMADLPRMLNHEGKENFLLSARDVVMAGAGSEEEKQSLLTRLGLALGMSEAHIRGVVMG